MAASEAVQSLSIAVQGLYLTLWYQERLVHSFMRLAIGVTMKEKCLAL